MSQPDDLVELDVDDRDPEGERVSLEPEQDEYMGCSTYDNRGVCNCSAGMPGGCQMQRRIPADDPYWEPSW